MIFLSSHSVWALKGNESESNIHPDLRSHEIGLKS